MKTAVSAKVMLALVLSASLLPVASVAGNLGADGKSDKAEWKAAKNAAKEWAKYYAQIPKSNPHAKCDSDVRKSAQKLHPTSGNVSWLDSVKFHYLGAHDVPGGGDACWGGTGAGAQKPSQIAFIAHLPDGWHRCCGLGAPDVAHLTQFACEEEAQPGSSIWDACNLNLQPGPESALSSGQPPQSGGSPSGAAR